VRRRTLALTAALVALGTFALTAAQSPELSFRSSVDTVLLTVSVKNGSRPVVDLTGKDFEVRDNNVVQAFEVAGPETLPIDLTLVIDVSGSSQGRTLESLTRAINSVAGRLRPMDRASVLTFNHRVHEERPLTFGWTPVSFERGTGSTALFDAATAALVATPEAGRRRMAVLFTDGIDTASFVDGSTLVDVAKRADTSLFIITITPGTTKQPQRTPYDALFQSWTTSTGGMLTVLQQDQAIGSAFDTAFEQFGTSYVLRYIVRGVLRPGWHDIAVRVTRPGRYELRARRGYFG